MSDQHGPVDVPVASSAPLVRRDAPAQMSPVVRAIMEKNLSPETVREMLAMQREHEANEARKQYVAAYIGLKAELPKILARDKRVKFGNTEYTHTSLAAAVEAVVPHLISHGFAHEWNPSIDDEGQVVVTCRLTHCGGHYEESTLKCAPDTKGSKSGPQTIASTITMLQRYTLLGRLGIATADMTEPKSEAPPVDPEKVDVNRNMKAVTWLKQQGKTLEQAEAFLCSEVGDWTAADLDRLREWAKPQQQNNQSK